VLRVSAGLDVNSRTASWLIQALDPQTGEVLHDATRGLLAAMSGKAGEGFVSYTVKAADTAVSGTVMSTQARILVDEAPPVESAVLSATLDADAPETHMAVTALGDNAGGQPVFDVQWQARDTASGISSVTVYVAENGGDFRIWIGKAPSDKTQALFVGEAGKTYEFLAVATDRAGNREAAVISNAVLPDDGARQAILDQLGVNATLEQSATTPQATQDRTYPANSLFEQALSVLPGHVATAQPGDLQSVVAPFTLRGLPTASLPVWPTKGHRPWSSWPMAVSWCPPGPTAMPCMFLTPRAVAV